MSRPTGWDRKETQTARRPARRERQRNAPLSHALFSLVTELTLLLHSPVVGAQVWILSRSEASIRHVLRWDVVRREPANMTTTREHDQTHPVFETTSTRDRLT